MILPVIIAVLSASTSVSIIEPIDGETYNGDWLSIRAIVENNNELPDSVHYVLNGTSVVQVPRLVTDWPTYLQNPLHHAFSESPAPTDNSILWTVAVTSDLHAFPTPVVVEGIVYYPQDCSGDSLYALDAATGEVIWKYFVGINDDAVTVENGLVYAASESLFCLNAETGERIWASGDADWSGGTPALSNGYVFAGRNINGQPDTIQVSCFNPLTGDIEWTAKLACGLTSYSCMAVWEGMIFLPTTNFHHQNQNAYLFALNAESGEVLWQNGDSFDGYWDSSPVIVDSTIYIGCSDSLCRAIDALSGETIWQSPMNTGIEATPSYHEGRLFLGDQADNFVSLSAETGVSVWEVPGCQHNASGIADGMVFYGEYYNTEGARVIALDCETGSEVWTYTTGSLTNRSGPAITDGVVYIAGEDFNLYAFGTGLKYTYLDDLFAPIGSNELIVTSYDEGASVAADTISFTVTQTGISLEPTRKLELHASPNPIRASTSISFAIDEPGMVSLRIFDLSGREISTLIDQELASGVHSVQWNGRHSSGYPVSSGLYLCRIESGGVVETTGLCVLR